MDGALRRRPLKAGSYTYRYISLRLLTAVAAGRLHADGVEQLQDVPPLDIVLAEDDPDIAFMHQRVLESDGHHVEVVRDGAGTIDAVREHDPDLLVLDMHMPNGDGFAVLEDLRANEKTTDQPVVVLSNSDLSEHEHHRLRRLGVIEFLAKWKVHPRALADWIKRWAAIHKPRRPRPRPGT